jgi:hypothetical protein
VSTWGTGIFSLLGVAVGIAGTLLSVRLQEKHARAARQDAERTRLQELGAATLGPIGSLLTDTDPNRLAFNLRPDSDTALMRSATGIPESSTRVNDSESPSQTA